MEKSSFNVSDILMKSTAVPDGTISKDGLYVKKAGEWKYRDKEERGLRAKDLKAGQSFNISTFKNENASLYIKEVHDDGTMTIAAGSSDGWSHTKRLTAKEVINGYLSNHISKPQTETTFNPKHFDSPEQASLAATFIDNIKNRKSDYHHKIELSPDLDLDHLPASAQREMSYWMERLQSQGQTRNISLGENFLNKNGVPPNQREFFKKYLGDQVSRIPSYYTPKDNYKDWRVFNKETLQMDKPKDLADSKLRSKVANLEEFAKAHPDVKIDPRVLKHQTLDLGDGQYAHLGDYILENKYLGRGSYMTTVSRLVGTISSASHGYAWKLKNKFHEGDKTQNIWAKNWDPSNSRLSIYAGDPNDTSHVKDGQPLINNLFPPASKGGM